MQKLSLTVANQLVFARLEGGFPLVKQSVKQLWYVARGKPECMAYK
jgi:hypothetical protein